MAVQKTLISNLIPTGGIAESKYVDGFRTVSNAVGLDLFDDLGYVKSALDISDSFTPTETIIGMSELYRHKGFGTTKIFYGSTFGSSITPDLKALSDINGGVITQTIKTVCDYYDYTYYASNAALFRIKDPSVTPLANEFVSWLNISSEFGLSSYANTYALTNAINEGAAHRISFVANGDSKVIGYIAFYVVAKGTGDWTIELHDSSNSTMGVTYVSYQIASADIPSSGWVVFALPTGSGKINNKISIGATYHVHLYSSNGTGTVKVNTVNDLTTSYGRILYSSTPVLYTLNKVLYVGSGRFIHQCELDVTTGTAVFSNKVLDIGSGTITALSSMGTELIIGTDEGIMYRWNTYSSSWSFASRPIGISIKAIWSLSNQVYCNAGSYGDIYAYDGANLALWGNLFSNRSSGAYVTQVINKDRYVLLGVSTTSATVRGGLFAFGKLREGLSPTISVMHTVTSATSYTLKIDSCVYDASNDTVVTCWTVNSVLHSGSLSANRYSGAYFETKIVKIDRSEYAEIIEVLVPYTSLPTNTDIKLYYKANYSASWTEITGKNDTNRMLKSFPFSIQGSVFEFKVELTTSTTLTPVVESLIIKFE